MAAIIVLNPVFSRQSIPAVAKTGLIALLTIIITPYIEVPALTTTMIDFLICIAKEFFIGFLLTFVFNIYYYMLMFAADLMDTQFGLSMAKMMNPQTNIQSATTGNLLNVVFMLYFFVTNSHLVLIGTAVGSYEAVPAGLTAIDIMGSCTFVIELFSSVFVLALRLALPYVAAEFVLELCLGLLMKLVPQIHAFVIHMQGKIILGLILLLALSIPMTNFIDNYITKMLGSMNQALGSLIVR
ncbi:MAG: flagellar biosynthetic protein FliR [Ruminococcus sp.]|nr:flagellar biosynthetic protein FliR [Ruminococcus sp.]MBO5383974.1 flagellar biosynthetic protein FliR [Ruminococcus sp.]